jgi:hypothetical protein
MAIADGPVIVGGDRRAWRRRSAAPARDLPVTVIERERRRGHPRHSDHRLRPADLRTVLSGPRYASATELAADAGVEVLTRRWSPTGRGSAA